LRLPLRDHDRLGPQDVRDPRRRRRRQARHQRPDRDQPRHPHPAGQLLLPGLGRTADFRAPRPGWQPGRPPPPVEPAHHPQAPEARLRQQLLLGDVAALVRRHRPPGPRHRRGGDGPAWGAPPPPPGGGPIARLWSTALSGLVDIGYIKATGNSVVINLPRTATKPEATFEWKIPQWSNAIERNRARTYFQAYAAAAALHFTEKALAHTRAGHTKTWETFKVPDEAVSCGFTEAVRGVLSHHMVIRNGKIANYH